MRGRTALMGGGKTDVFFVVDVGFVIMGGRKSNVFLVEARRSASTISGGPNVSLVEGVVCVLTGGRNNNAKSATETVISAICAIRRTFRNMYYRGIPTAKIIYSC